MIRFVGQCEKVPRGYGAAWEPYNRMGVYVAPIPLNVAIALGVRLYRFLVYHPAWFGRDRIRPMLSRARRLGRSQGWIYGVKHQQPQIDRLRVEVEALTNLCTRVQRILMGEKVE